MKRATRWWIVVGILGSLLVVAFGVRRAAKRSGGPWASAPQPAASNRVQQPLEIAELLYEAKLASGWDDWGWGPHQLGNGPAQVVFANYGGILFHHAELAPDFGGVTFRYKAPAAWGEFMHVSLRWASAPDESFPTVPLELRHVAQLEDGWREALVPWAELNPKGQPFDRVMIGSHSQVGTDWVLLERVALTKPSGAVAEPTQQDEALQVLCDGPTHPIDELIYGAASGVWSSGQSAQRIGGNPLSRMNWDLATWNTGADWYFENTSQPSTPFANLDGAAKAKQRTVMVVPLLGWVAKDGVSVGFPRDKFGPQRGYDPYKTHAGDGMGPDGKPLASGDPSLTSVPAPPELIKKWIERVVAQDVKRGSRSLDMYLLDNEPSLWSTTHRDVHPKPLSYDELLERTIQYASAIRAADPQGVIAGPAEWGWLGYQYSAVDREAGYDKQPDRLAHGGMPLVAWYLKQLAAHEKATGTRLLDVLDLHFYPAAERVFGDKVFDDARTSALRLRSTRALWDPTYQDESWINEKIQLIPRMKEWVSTYYPGLKLAIGEWNFGAEQHISGGLATAEALGRFGQQGLDAAFHWGDLKEGTPSYWAFRAFRNFDGKGARFQDVSMAVKEGDKLSLFASRDSGSTRVVLVLINRSATSAIKAKIALRGCGPATSSRLFSYGPRSKSLEPGSAALVAAGDGISAELEPYSLAVVELKLGEAHSNP